MAIALKILEIRRVAFLKLLYLLDCNRMASESGIAQPYPVFFVLALTYRRSLGKI
jgi:hypothetical protein